MKQLMFAMVVLNAMAFGIESRALAEEALKVNDTIIVYVNEGSFAGTWPNTGRNAQFVAVSKSDPRTTIKFTILARIVEVRANGTLEIESFAKHRRKEGTVEPTLSGIIRPEDVLPNNTVMCEDIYNLTIHKTSDGKAVAGMDTAAQAEGGAR